MRLDDSRESRNVEDRRGARMGGAGGLGAGAVIIALIASYFLGIDPRAILGVVEGIQTQPPAQTQSAPINDEASRFIRKVLGETEDVWNGVFRGRGADYPEPQLVLFSGQTPTACGTGQSAMGPFYCPVDRKVYIDLAFYQQLRDRFQAPGDFAQAYVIAHEVGHHVQNVLGILSKVDEMRARLPRAQGNALSVRVELQADCFAGMWARQADDARRILERGDLEEALRAASAIGDDTLQRQSQGRIVPDSFTHGTSEQRVRWFRRGFDSGRIESCDTFGARNL